MFGFGSIGKAVIEITGDASNFDADAQKAGTGIGSKMAAGLGAALKVGVGAAVAGVGVVIAKGFGRLNALDQAQAKMRGLGYEGEALQGIMDSALKSVEGTAFGLGDAAQAAANALNAGVQEGDQLDRTLQAVVGSAAASGASMVELQGIFNKAATAGKANNEVLGMLSERGIPIVKQLAEDLGVPREQVAQLARDGKISFDQLIDSAGAASGTIAEEMGKTLQGRLSNAWASIGRIGANLLGGVFDKLGPGIGTVTDGLKKLEPYATTVGEAIGNFLDRAIDGFKNIKDAVVGSGVVDVVSQFFSILRGDNNDAADGIAWAQPFMDLATKLSEAKDVVSQFFSVLRGDNNDAADSVPWAGPLIDLANVITDRIVPTFDKFFQQLKADIVPILQRVGIFVQDNVVPAFKLVAGFIIDTVVPALAGIGATISENVLPIVSKIVEVFNKYVMPALTGFGKVITDKVVPFLVRLAEAIVPVVKWVVELAVKILGKVIPVILDFAGPVIGFLIKAAGWLFGAIFDAFNGIFDVIGKVVSWVTESVVPWLQGAWETIKEGAQQLWGYIEIAWEGIKTAVSAVVDWLTGTAWPFVKDVFDKIGAAAEWLYVNFIRPQWILIKAGIEVVVNWLNDTAWPFIKQVFDWIGEAAKWLWEKAIKPAWEGIKKGISAVVDWMKNTAWPVIKQVWDWIAGGVKWLWENAIKPAWDNIKSGIDTVVGWMKNTAWPWIKGVWDNIGDGAKKLYDNFIKPAFDNVKTALDTLVTGFQNTKDAISRAWDGFKDAISGPIRSALTWINDHFIKPANSLFEKLQMTFRLPTINFATGGSVGASTSGGPIRALASGGVLPGYTPGRDVHEFIGRAGRLLLSGGEAIMRPEWTRAVGKRTIDVWNAASRRGPGAVRQVMGFSGGGVLPTHAYRLGGAVDWLKKRGTDIVDWTSATAKALTNPAEFVRNMITSAINRLGVAGPLGDMAKSVVERTVSTIVSKIKSFASEPGTGTREGGGMGWKAMAAWFENAFPGKRITSGYRSGARSITGIVSDHALGRAIDMPPSMEIFNTIDRTWKNIRQLLYSPAGPRQIRGYRRSDTIGSPLRAQHWDHVHWAMAKGGIFDSPFKPFVADRGAVLAPGLNLLDNRTGGPEPLTRADQAPTIGTLNIELRMDDLEQIETLRDFLDMLKVQTLMHAGTGGEF